MDFEPSEEQELLRRTARELLSEHAPRAHVRAMIEDPRGYSPELWSRLAALGWTGLLLPEALGGAGLGLTDLLPVAEELGRALTPVPYLPTLMAGCAVHEAGSAAQQREWLPRICEGRAVATLAAGDDAPPAAARDGDGFRLRGRVRFVPDAHVADLLVVAARTGDTEEGRGLFLVPGDAPGVRVLPVATIDPLRRLSDVELDGVRLPAGALLGGAGDAGRRLDRALDAARVMVSAEMVGGAEKCLEDAVAHAKGRVQFGRPIGVHQAVQHRCADMLFAVESAKSIVHYAAWALDERTGDAPLAAAMAKASASDAYRSVSAASIQIHGGIGFTWELDCHLYYKRARSDEVWLGDGRRSRERVARLLDL